MMLKNILRSLSIIELFKVYNKYKMTSSNAIRMPYYWLLTGYLKSVLEKGQYDVVHIHGLKYPTIFWEKVCRDSDVPVLFTSHGLNSFSDIVTMEPEEKRYERDLLRRVVQGEVTLTVISTGMKRLIEKKYNVDDCKNLIVVCNSFSFNIARDEEESFNVRSEHHLPADVKMIVCVGNICERKNQGQLVRSFDYLPEFLAKKTYILFLGDNTKRDYSIEILSKNSKWKDHFIVCGVVPKEQVHYYYEQSDGVALISLSEGFGLSLIEGMHFGKPSMTFVDVDAYNDIYHSGVMVGIEEHSDEAVARGLEKLLTSEWNEEFIRVYSHKFENQSMAENYVRVYKMLIKL